MSGILQTVGSIFQGDSAKKAADFNAGILQQEGKAAMQQSGVAEATQRRSGREALGRQAAAIAQSGMGSGGSSGAELDQSAVNAELDALNVRYRGQVSQFGQNTQALIDQQAGSNARTAGYIKAGTQLLNNSADYASNFLAAG